MLLISCLFGIGGLASEKIYVIDWWRPLTITHTRIGVEDFIIGFSIGGVAAVIYEEVYKMHLSRKKSKTFPPSEPLAFLLGFILLCLVLFYFFNLSSFYSTSISYLLFIGYMLYARKDLIRNAIYSGLWVLFIGIGIYLLLFLFFPGYIQRFWFLPHQWYARLYFGIPFGEYIWYFLTGMFIGPLYEFVKHRKLLKG